MQHRALRIYNSPEGKAALERWYDDALTRLPVPHESRTVPTRYGTTHLLVAGPTDATAPPLVLVQGYGASAPLWNKQLADFTAQRRVYALDIPGQPGRSEPALLSPLNTSYTDWLGDVLDGLGLTHVHLVGICLGGTMALRMAASHPERLVSVVLLSPVGIANLKIYVRSGFPLALNYGDRDKAARRILQIGFAPPGSGLQMDRELGRALGLVTRHYNAGLIGGITSERPTPREVWTAVRTLRRFVAAEPAAMLRQITVPTLLLVGQHESLYNPHKAVARARRYIPDIRAEIVPQAGHGTIYNRPDWVNPRVLQFIAEVEQRGQGTGSKE